MLIRDLGGLGFCYPVTAASPYSPVPSEIWEHAYRLPTSPSSPYRARPHSGQPCLLNCVSTPILVEPQPGFFFYSLAQHFLPSVDLSGWEYFCESDFKIIWSGLVPNAHICHLLKGLTVLHNFLSVLNLALTVQGNYCKGHTFINWNHKNFVGVLIKWGDLRFKWHIESFTNGNTAHLGESRWKITGEWKHQIAPHRGHRECQQFSLLWFRFCQALAMEPRTPCRLGKPSNPELQLQPLLNSRKTFSLEIPFAACFFFFPSMRRLAGVNLSRCLPSFGSICPTRNDFIL